MFIDWKDIVKIATLPKTTYRFNAVKIPMIIFTDIEKKKLVWNNERLRIVREILKNWKFHTSWFFKLHYKAIVIKTGHCWHKNIHIGLGTESRAQK